VVGGLRFLAIGLNVGINRSWHSQFGRSEVQPSVVG